MVACLTDTLDFPVICHDRIGRSVYVVGPHRYR